MKRTFGYYIRKANEMQQHADVVSDPWLKRSLEDIANGYRLLAERMDKDERSSPSTGDWPHRSAHKAH
jgi:hypothetical protein